MEHESISFVERLLLWRSRHSSFSDGGGGGNRLGDSGQLLPTA